MIVLGFALTILAGGLILYLGPCTVPGEHTSFTDAMFTATTCVCVTGLVTVTTAGHWTLAGKAVILILIQIGGIGFIALASLIFITLHRKISLRDRRMIQESYNLDRMSGVVMVVKRVVLCVFSAEAVGALFYSIRFVPLFGPVKGMGQAVFTSVSAFCNAGVDLLGENSLAPFAADPLVNLTTMGLIIASGLGFTVWWDLHEKMKKVYKGEIPPGRWYARLRFHSKLVLCTTGILIFGGALLIFIFEYNNPATLGQMPLWEKVMASFFQSVTTRTAGFFTVDQGSLTNASALLCLGLMFIGGSPMGTAGGIKTTTAAVLVLDVLANLKGKRDAEFAHRRIRDGYIRSALVVAGMGILTLFFLCICLTAAMPGEDMLDVLYEVTSAAATVGLTRGLTPRLNLAGKWIIIAAMYLGRIGPLTLGSAVMAGSKKFKGEGTHLAEEDLMIG